MKATTIRFSDEVYTQLEKASKDSGLPINSIVVVATLHWLGGAQAGVLGRSRFRDLVPRFNRPRWSFEMFSQAARRSIELAQEEADQAGSRYIGTDHLLAGLIRVEEGVAARLLQQAGVSLTDVRAGIEAPGEKPARILPTSRFKKVVEAAIKICRQEGAAHVGSEHLLLGIVVVGEGRAAAYLEEHGLTSNQIWAKLAEMGREA